MVGHNASYIRTGRIVTVELRAVHILRGELSRAVDGCLAVDLFSSGVFRFGLVRLIAEGNPHDHPALEREYGRRSAAHLSAFMMKNEGWNRGTLLANTLCCFFGQCTCMDFSFSAWYRPGPMAVGVPWNSFGCCCGTGL